MSTAGRLQDLLHDIIYGRDCGYGERADGIGDKLDLNSEQQAELFAALEEPMFHFVAAERIRAIGMSK